MFAKMRWPQDCFAIVFVKIPCINMASSMFDCLSVQSQLSEVNDNDHIVCNCLCFFTLTPGTSHARDIFFPDDPPL